jgi:hypothetical protein
LVQINGKDARMSAGGGFTYNAFVKKTQNFEFVATLSDGRRKKITFQVIVGTP